MIATLQTARLMPVLMSVAAVSGLPLLLITTLAKDFHHLSIDKANTRYGLSTDTADRGLRKLHDAETLTARTIYIPYVLAATG